eukprot:4470798-Pyramimonas_sp.AAC.1
MATLSAAPHRCQNLFDFRHPAELSALGAALAKGQSLKSSAVKSLRSYWVALHAPIMHVECKPIAPEPKRKKLERPPCRTIG